MSTEPSRPEPARLARLSMSLPADLFRQLDVMVEERGLPSRSQLIAELIRHALAEHEALTRPENMLAGTVTIVYAGSGGRVRQQLAETQSDYLKEVISSQHVFLEQDQSLEVLLVQGPAVRLKQLCDALRTIRGGAAIATGHHHRAAAAVARAGRRGRNSGTGGRRMSQTPSAQVLGDPKAARDHAPCTRKHPGRDDARAPAAGRRSARRRACRRSPVGRNHCAGGAMPRAGWHAGTRLRLIDKGGDACASLKHLQRRIADRTAQCCRYREGPVERLSRRWQAAAVGYGAGDDEYPCR